MVFIYILIDPQTNEIRYVGKTKHPLAQRLSEHCSHAMTSKKRNKRLNWIRSVLRKGYVPIMELVQEVPESIWGQAEKYWVAYYGAIGCDLTNGTEGGEGPDSHTEADRAKQSRAQTGRQDSPETRAKKAAHLRRVAPTPGYTLNLSDEERAARSERAQGNQHGVGNKSRTGQKRSAEEVDKQRQKMVGKERSSATRAKISTALTGKPKSPESVAKMRESLLRRNALKLAVQDWT